MTERTPQSHRPILRMMIILFLICLVSLVFLLVSFIRGQVKQSFGESDTNLSANQAAIYGFQLFINQNRLNATSKTNSDVAFTVKSGEQIDMLINDLKTMGLVSDETLFRVMLIYTGADRRVLPGTYIFPAGSSMHAVSQILQDPDASLVEFNVLPGWRKEEIAESLPTSGLGISVEQFLTIVNRPLNDQELTGGEAASYEGFLAPGAYLFRRNTSAGVFVATLVDRSRVILSPKLREAYTNQGLTTYQAVILASIIQREAMLDEEKPLIASVFIKRLNMGMPLQSDPTAQYALGYNPEWGWWKSPLSLQDVHIESIYNTYIINGLPPTPISNPDELSLKAVAFPEESTYLYFRAACENNGKHVFSETIEEHTMNGCPQAGS